MRDATRPDASGAATTRDLLPYRIHRLAGALSRGGALRCRAGFGVALVDGGCWRCWAASRQRPRRPSRAKPGWTRAK